MIKYLILLIIFVNICFSQEFYISKSGNDNNNGSKEKPFLTIEKAIESVRLLKKTNGQSQNITVWLRAGKYNLNKSIELKEMDSGENGFYIEYRSFPNEKVVITGSCELDPMKIMKVHDDKILSRIPKEARKYIVGYDLKADGLLNYGEHNQIGHGLSVSSAPMELFINDQIMKLAQYPNDSYIMIGKVIDPGSVPRIKDYSNRGGIFEYTDSRHARWTKAEDLWLQGTFKYGFADDKIKVESIDTIKKQVKLSSPHLYGIGSGENFNHYIALNLLEEIDTPGEYYIDRKNGILYLYPPQDLSKTEISVSLLEKPIISLVDVSNIRISGITIENGRGIGIYIESGNGNIISGCTVRNMGTSGIFMGQGAMQLSKGVTIDEDYSGEAISGQIGNLQGQLYNNTTWDRRGGKNHKIISCDVYNTGCGGIYLSGGSKKDLILGNCLVENCKVHDYNRRTKFLWSGINVDGCGNIVRNNEIFNSDYQGIYVHGNEHIFEYNYIHNVAENSNDVSGWYTGRDPSDRGNIIRYNYFENIGRPDRKWTMGVYFDDAACDALVEGNVFYNAGSYGAVYSNAGQDLIIRNNIFIDINGPVLQLKSMWWDFASDSGNWKYYFGESGIYRKRLTKSLDIKKPPYSEKYPNLINWIDLTTDGKTYYGMYPERNKFENNVLFKCEETIRMVGKNAKFELGNNLIVHSDPGFIDYSGKNFKLRENSMVFKEISEFKQIPFEKIGLYEDEFRTSLKEK
jgi:parallel beta-helix repeat protein